jgi:hypothetical protein
VPETRRGSRDQVRAGKAARAMEKGSAGISSCHLQATEYTPERAPGALQASRLGLALMNLTARTDIIECSFSVAAVLRCREAGWQVAIVDARPFGGTCELRECDPKKVLVGAGALIDAMRRMTGKSVKTDGAHIDWAELMRFLFLLIRREACVGCSLYQSLGVSFRVIKGDDSLLLLVSKFDL